MGELEDWIDENLGENKEITWHEDIPIPAGFYYVGGEKNTGLIISDSAEDENKY